MAASRNLPAFAAGNPYIFFEAAERYERANGVCFEEWKITLPQELTLDQNTALMEDLVQAIAGDTLPITYAFHNPRTTDHAKDQPHLHLLISARRKDGIDRTAQHYFRRYNAAHPGRGGAQKSPLMNTYHATKQHRVLIADVLNMHLELRGQVARIHPDRLEARGIDRKPEPKLDPAESSAYRKKGKISARMQQVLTTRAQRDRIKEQNQARSYWEERKDTLGIDRAMPMGEKLRRIVQARRARVTGPVAHTKVEHLAYEQQAITRAIQREHARTGRGLQGPRVQRRGVQTLAAQLRRLEVALGRDEEQAAGARVRIRLQDEEWEHDQGHGI